MTDVESTLDALSGKEPPLFEGRDRALHVTVRAQERSYVNDPPGYQVTVGNYMVATCPDRYFANALGAALHAGLPQHGSSGAYMLDIAIRNLYRLSSLRVVLIDVLRQAAQEYERRSTDPTEPAVYETRKIARVLREELTQLGDQQP